MYLSDCYNVNNELGDCAFITDVFVHLMHVPAVQWHDFVNMLVLLCVGPVDHYRTARNDY